MWKYSTKYKLSSQIFHYGITVQLKGNILLEVYFGIFDMGCAYVSMSFCFCVPWIYMKIHEFRQL